jgi:hypothetical protein
MQLRTVQNIARVISRVDMEIACSISLAIVTSVERVLFEYGEQSNIF